MRTVAVNGSGTATIRYDYDPLGRRISKSVNGTQTLYLLDGDEEIAELTSTGTVLRRYVTGPAVDDRVAVIEGSSTAPAASSRSYYHTNHQGSVIATTAANGTVGQRLAYDAYGNLSQGSITTGQPYRYVGRRFDEETGLYYYRARYYAPVLGRFLQTDPVGYVDDVNLYAYVKNDPLNATDPTGQFADVVLDLGFIAYDVYSLATDPSLTNAVALGLDVAGAVVPFVTGAGQTYRTASALHSIAKEADKISTAGMSARAAGTAKHTEAAALTREGVPGAKVEQAYKGGEEQRSRVAGSRSPDVVTEGRGGRQPFDFKFGDKGTSGSRNAANKQAVVTSKDTIDIRPGTPPAGRVTGLGAACNASADLGAGGPCSQ